MARARTHTANGVARAYVRVSDARSQGEGASLGTQLAAITVYAQAQHLTIVQVYQDMESGRTGSRTQYQQLIADIERGDTVLSFQLDRAGRNAFEMLSFREMIEQRGAFLVFVDEPETSNPLMFVVKAGFAEYFSAQLAVKVKANMRHIAETEGRWISRIPRWYELPVKPRIGKERRRYAPGEGRLVPAPDAADAQRAFDHYLATRNQRATAEAFGLHAGAFGRMLRNRVYLGETEWNGIVTADTHPAIVTRETFDAVQELLAERALLGRRERGGISLLAGVIYVEGGDRRMYACTYGRHRYYATTSDDHYPRHAVRADRAEDAAIDALRTLTLSPDEERVALRQVRELVRDDPDKRERATLLRKGTALASERVQTARMLAQGRIDDGTHAGMTAQQAAEGRRIADRLAALAPVPELASARVAVAMRVNLTASIDAAYASGNVAALRILVDGLIARVEVYDALSAGLRGKGAAIRKRCPPRVTVKLKPGMVS